MKSPSVASSPRRRKLVFAVGNRRVAVALLVVPTVLVFSVTLLLAGQTYPLWRRSGGTSAFDVAVFMSLVCGILQGTLGLIVNNFMFRASKKDWRDFWTMSLLEFLLSDSTEGWEPWRLARGRFVFYTLAVVATFCLFIGYLQLRAV